jgi:hypothetical protein
VATFLVSSRLLGYHVWSSWLWASLIFGLCESIRPSQLWTADQWLLFSLCFRLRPPHVEQLTTVQLFWSLLILWSLRECQAITTWNSWAVAPFPVSARLRPPHVVHSWPLSNSFNLCESVRTPQLVQLTDVPLSARMSAIHTMVLLTYGRFLVSSTILGHHNLIQSIWWPLF